MRALKSRFAVCCLFVLLPLTAVGQQTTAPLAVDARRPKKLIATGWDHADSRQLRENLAVMEKQPFAGVVVDVTGPIDAKRRCALRTTFSNKPWERQWFDACVQDLKACKFTRFTDNFLLVGANPGDVDYFDDEGWSAIVAHWRIAAQIAKQSGFKGLLFDPEPYSQPHSQFAYPAQPQKDKHSFEEYCLKARQRGRETMQAVAAEFPEIVLFCCFMNSVNAHAAGQTDPQALLAGQGYGLLPAFFDGWLDAAPPTVTMVDGCESAYSYNSVNAYLEAGNLMHGNCQELVSPANRAKYRAQVQVSFGLYLDAYCNPTTSPWYIDGLGGPREQRLRENVRTALRVADEYVWVYGEKYRWFPTPNGSVKKEYWPEILPGADRILALASNPIPFARRMISENHPANLARNGDFSAEKIQDEDGKIAVWKEGGRPAGWSAWQADKSKGVFVWDREIGCAAKGAARASNVAEGCFIQSIPARPGEAYAVSCRCRIQGKGDARIPLKAPATLPYCSASAASPHRRMWFGLMTLKFSGWNEGVQKLSKSILRNHLSFVYGFG
ncbi:MAG: hypothetical protein NTX50_20910 [Candidatus Sumerlaeota bacterium]|nr:hypothetical protein [Candidatus Sumerlaeota bacterium]